MLKINMNEINIPYHLTMPSFFCIIGIVFIYIYRSRLFHKNKILWISLTTFLIIYLYFVGNAAFDDIFFQWELNKYDLNKDGFFSGEELTEEQDKAMNRLISDVGRNFSVITGFIFAFIVSILVYIIGIIIKKVKH